jgi:hypothetical protein
MANVKISELTAASTPLAGTEVLPIVQSTATVKVAVSDLTAGRAVSASSLTLSGGTANGVAYLNGSKVVTTGSALVFDGANFGVGVTPSAYGSGFRAIQVGAAGNISAQTSTKTIEIASNAYNNGGWKYQANDKASLYYQYNGEHVWNSVATGGAAGSAISFAQTMTLTAAGDLLVGTTSQITNEKLSVNTGNTVGVGVKTTGGASNSPFLSWNATTTGDGFFAAFATETSITVRGSITYNRTAGLTSYNTTSDYRAKDISGPILNSGALIDSVPVYMGKMKGATQERPMFIAHETPAYTHTGVKDAVDKNGKPIYQQMDASALIPVMWAEIQSLRQRLAAANL